VTAAKAWLDCILPDQVRSVFVLSLIVLDYFFIGEAIRSEESHFRAEYCVLVGDDKSVRLFRMIQISTRASILTIVYVTLVCRFASPPTSMLIRRISITKNLSVNPSIRKQS
jgi:hypothetical protein